MDSRTGPRGHDRRRLGRLIVASVLPLVIIAAAVSGCGETARDQAASVAASAKASTADRAKTARANAEDLARDGKYVAAVAAYESAGLDADADRARRRGARALYRSARRALAGGHYASARRLAIQSRQLRKTASARTVLSSANAKLAAAKAAERERRRLARIAKAARTCTSDEKATVRIGGGTPSGCAAYAAQRARREAEPTPAPSSDCDPNYTGACLKPDSPDYDCAGGSGDGPDYTGAVQSVGSDPYGLDRDGDGSACEG